MYDIHIIVQFLVNGVGVGCIYGLVGIGFCVIFNASGIVNFAQGAFVMLGGMATVALRDAGLPLYVAAPGAILAVSVLGMGVEFWLVRPLWRRQATPFMLILATLAIQVLLENGALHLWGDQPRNLPDFTPGEPIWIMGVAIGRQILWIIGVSLAIIAGLALLYRGTLIGKAMRAAAVNREMATLLGISVPRMLSISFALSAALGAVGGILIAPTQYTAFNIGVPFAVDGFIAAVLGGFGHAGGAFLGGILLGVLQALAVAFLDSGSKNIAALVVLLALLLVRPNGLFGSLVEE